MVPMFLQRYVHMVLDAVLGSYVKNIDPDALKISVWNGKIEVDAVELRPDAFPLPKEFALVKGTLHQLRIDMPWTNLASQPIRVDIEDMSLLLQVRDTKAAASESDADESPASADALKKRQETLRRKRATMDAIERATQFNERNVALVQGQSWTHSFFFKLLVKVLDNVQLHVQHLHLRLEDRVSDPAQPYAVGVTLESLIIKSADAGWNYTMVVRGQASGSADDATATILRKKMDINKFGVYWSLPLAPVPAAVLDDSFAFARLMQMNFWSPDAPAMVSKTAFPPLFQPQDYIIHPLTVSMKLTVNDGNAKLPLTHQELSDRVLSRLGTPWMIETIDAIGDTAWREFLAAMPPLARDRKYTLGFVFSEAWAVARDLTDEEDVIPSLEQFQVALASCLQWSRHETTRLAASIAKYRDAVVHIMDEKSTYIDATASVDHVRLTLSRTQYLSALSLASFLTVKRRQARYVSIRPKRVRVKDNPAAWWQYAIRAVLLDVRERLARVDWDALQREKAQRRRYMELYLVLAHSTSYAATCVSADVKALTKDAAAAALDDLEVAMDVKDLLRLRRAARKEVDEREHERQEEEAQRRTQPGAADSKAGAAAPPPASTSLWSSYASWLTGAATGAPAAPSASDTSATAGDAPVDDVRWSEQDTKDLYDAINFHPQPSSGSSARSNASSGKDGASSPSKGTAQAQDESAAAVATTQEQQHIWYRFQLGLTKASFGLYKDTVPAAASDRATPPSDSPGTLRSSSVDLVTLNADRLDLSDLGDTIGTVNAAEEDAMWSPRPASTCLLLASLDDVAIQVLVRPASLEMGLHVRDAFFCQDPDVRLASSAGRAQQQQHRAFFLQRMAMDEVLQYHPEGAREKISSVRLRECERELPLLALSIESRTDVASDDASASDTSAADAVVTPRAPALARVLRISLVTQPIKCNVNLMYLLEVSACFSRPLHVDLSGLEQSAWKRAQSLQRYSTAQLREALARRTRVEMQLDVISPLINIVEVHSESAAGRVFDDADATQKQVSLLVFLGHLRASTIHPTAAAPTDALPPSPLKLVAGSDTAGSVATAAAALVQRQFLTSPVGQNVYDILEFSISGIQVQLFDGSEGHDGAGGAAQFWFLGGDRAHVRASSWSYLLEKTSLTFSFHMSVAPDDPTIPLLKLFGGVDSVHVNLSAANFRSVLSLLQSFSENLTTYSKRKVASGAAVAGIPATRTRGSPSPSQIHTPGLDPTAIHGVRSLATTAAREIPPRLVKSASYFASAPMAHRPGGDFASATAAAAGMRGKESVSDSNLYASFAKALDHERERARRKEIEDKDLLKLWKRVMCHLQFGVGEVVLQLQIRDDTSVSEKLVVVRAGDINTRLKMRTFDRRLEFALGTFAVEDIVRSRLSADASLPPRVVERKRYLMASGSGSNVHPDTGYSERAHADSETELPLPPKSSEQLIRVAITSIASDAEMPKDTGLWRYITYDPVVAVASDHSIWQDPLVTPLSVDASLRTLTINLYQDTVAEMFVFFFERDDDPVGAASPEHHDTADDDASHLRRGEVPIPSMSNYGTATPFDVDDMFPTHSPAAGVGDDDAIGIGGGTLTKKFGAWVASSFLENLPGSGSTPDRLRSNTLRDAADHHYGTGSPEAEATTLDGSPASIQLRLHVDGLSLFLHLEDRQRRDGMASAFMSLTTEKFCCCVHKYPLYLGVFSYLTSLKVSDVSLSEPHFREIISHASSGSATGANGAGVAQASASLLPGHVPTLDETLCKLDGVPAVFSCAAQFYGADRIQEAWHPGYANRFSVRLKSPRMRFLYSFVDDLRRYFVEGELLQTIFAVLFRERADMVWEGDFQRAMRHTGGGSSHGYGPSSHYGESPLPFKDPRFLGSDVVSMFPLVDVQLTDAVLEMPPHRMSSEALVVRLDRFRVTNEHVLASVREMENRIVAKVLLNASLTQLQLDLSSLRIVSVILMEPSSGDDSDTATHTAAAAVPGGYTTQSLLGSTDMHVAVDFRTRAAMKIDVCMSPLRLVCNQKQYAFVLRVPMQNYHERSRYYFAAPAHKPSSSASRLPRDSKGALRIEDKRRSASVFTTAGGGAGGSDAHQSVIYEESESYYSDMDDNDDDDERHVLVSVVIPELSVELLQGHDGYHPSVSGDLCMAERDKTNRGSICVLDVTAYDGRVDYCLSTGQLVLDAEIDGIHIRDSRIHAKLSVPYRDVVVFERGPDGRAKSLAVHFVRATDIVDIEHIGIDASFLSSSSSLKKSASTVSPKRTASAAASPSDAYKRARSRSPVRTLSSRALFRFASPAKPPARRRKESNASVASHKSRSWSAYTGQPSGVDESESVMGEHHLSASEGSAGPPQIGRETRMDLILDIVGFRVIPSNIYMNVLRFLDVSQSREQDDESAEVYELSAAAGANGAATEDAASDHGEGDHAAGDDIQESGDDDDSDESLVLEYRKIGLQVNLGPSALLLVEDPTKDKSRALMLSWDAAISLEFLQQLGDQDVETAPSVKPSQSHNQLQLRTNINSIHATSRIPDDSIWASAHVFNAATADCLKPIDLELVLHIDLVNQFVRFRSKFDRVMELRFGYLDFCTAVAAIEHIVRSPWDVPETSEAKARKRTSSGSSSSLVSIGGSAGESDGDFGDRSSTASTTAPSLRGLSMRGASSANALHAKAAGDAKGSPALYGQTLIHFVSMSVRGRLQSRPVVGLYNSPWRKRYLVLPYTSQERNMVEAVAFRIVPAPGSRRALGDQVYYGDRIVLEAVMAGDDAAAAATTPSRDVREASPSRSPGFGPLASATASAGSPAPLPICKYDQLGANGYLGPDGSAGAFVTTIWKHGSTMFNSDRSVVFDKDIVVLEELTLNRAFNRAKSAAIVRKRLSTAKTKAVADAEQAVSASGGEGGGYLMFNGVGDAPVPFALSIVKRDAWSGGASALATTLDDDSSEMLEADRDARSKRKRSATPSESSRHAASIAQQLSLLQHLKIIEFTLPGLHATVVNDFHNMLLPLLHFRVAMLHADVRGRFDDKFTALASLRVGVQAYNSQLAVWEPVVEDFDVNMAYHNRGGVLCDFCMSERLEVSPSGSVLRCDGIPKCLFRSSRTEVFADAVAHACEAKHFIDRELLHQTDDQSAKHANTCLLVIKKDLNVNLSRNVLNVLVHFQALVSKAATTDDAALLARLGPFIYVDNQSGIPFLVATHSASGSAPPPSGGAADALNPFHGTETGSFDIPTAVPSSGDGEQTDRALLEAETTAFERSAWSRRRLSTMLNDISSSRTTWLKVPSGERIATDIVAHETPAGSVTSPLRRLLWLKPQSETRAALATSSSGKAIPVPIGYSNRSYLYLESHNGAQDVWHGESVICETVAEQGTLVLRLRGKVQLTNYLDVPIQVLYNEARVETIAPGAQAAHYIPIQYLERGTISFCPLLRNGELQKSAPLAIRSLLQSDAAAPKKRSQRQQQIGSLELRKALTFYWNAHPEPLSPAGSRGKTALDGMDFAGIPLPPFQLILTATRKSERHETMISLRAPIELENLIPYEVAFRTACLKSDDDVVYVEQHPASFPGTHGTIASGSCALISELELLSDGFGASDVQDVPSIVALSLAIPEIRLGSYSAWSAQRFMYGCQSFCERLELSMDSSSSSSAGADDADASRVTNKLTICVEVTQLEKLRTKALNGLCPVICRIFTEYWLIDRTSLSLSFYTADGYCIPSNHTLAIAADRGTGDATPDTTPPNVSLSVFSSESKQHVSKMKVGIQTTHGSGDEPTEVRSDAFDISAVGVRGQILVPTHHRESRNLLATILERPPSASSLGSSAAASYQQFDFGVTIEQGPGKFARSKVVTLVSRYYFVNTSHRFDVHIRQERSAATSDTVLVLAPKASRIFHWTDVRLPSRVQIRFAQPGTSPASTSLTALSQWSSPFALSSVGNFVLQLQKNLTPAPASLPQCYEANAPARALHDSVGDSDYLVGDGYWPDDALEAEQMIAGGMQLHVAVELHDPSFFVYLEEGAFESSPSRGLLVSSDVGDADVRYELSREKEKDAFVPYRIQNECSEYALVVWQKIVTKDDRGNAVVGFEGGETVLPFHTIDYVPYTFSSVLTVFVQIQKVSGLKRKLKKGSARGSSKTRGSSSATPRSSALATDVPTLVLASFEAQLNKLHRLPTLELEDTKARKRLWAEVLLDQATKTLQVTDMLPGVSAEHKRRRRSSLLRSWKRYSASILSISHALASRVPPKPETPERLASGATGSATKKKQVRFAEARVSDSTQDCGDGNVGDATGDGNDDSDTATAQASAGVSDLEPALDSAGAASLSTSPGGGVPAPPPPPGFVLSVKVVDVVYLEELLKKRGRSDFSSSQPFLYVSLRSAASATASATASSTSGRSKLVPQQAAVFPRWVPSHESSSLLSLTIPDTGDAGDAAASTGVDSASGKASGALDPVVNIQVREPDKLLFGSSLLAAVNIPLAAYLAETKRSRQADSGSPLAFPDVHEVLVPIDVVREAGALDAGDEGTRAMVKLQLCCQHVASIASSERALSDVQGALVAFSMTQELEGLVSSKTRLKSLLEGESVDVTTGRDDVVPPREKQAPATLSPSSSLSSGLTASSVEEHTRRSVNRGGSTLSVTTDDTTSDFGGLEDLSDEKRLTAVLVGVSNLQIPSRLLAASDASASALADGADEPKVYCTITYKESTRSAASSIAKASPDASSAAAAAGADESAGIGASKAPAPLEHVRTHTFSRGQALGLDLVYKSGRVLVQGVACDGPCGALLLEGKIRIGDTVVAVNSKPIVNLHREASFSVIERALAPVASSGGVEVDAVVSLSFLYQPLAQRARLPSASRGRTSSSSSSKHAAAGAEVPQLRAFDAEWNRRVEFTEVVTSSDAASHRAEAEERVLVRVYLRNSTADHGLSTAQEPSVVPFLYFFGDDTMMDHLDHSKQDSRFDVLLAECWVPLPSTTSEAFRAAAADPTGSVEIPFDERICALYAPQIAASPAESAIEMVGQLRLALKWDLVNRDRAAQDADALRLYCQLEVARVCLSIVDDASSAVAVVTGSAHQPREVLCISLSDQHASAGIQLSYGLTSGGKHVVNARVGHFQVDNQLLDTNYPVMLSPIRLVDEQQLHRGFDVSAGAGSSATGSNSGRARDGSSGTGGTGASGSSSTTGGPMLLPTLQLTSVFSIKPTLVQFEYIFGQLQELEIKLEDSLLVALAQAFSGVKWSSSSGSSSSGDSKPHEHTAVPSARSSNLALHLLEKDWSSRMAILSSNTSATLGGGSGANVKVLLRWLLLCPVKVNVTFTSTADRSLLLSLLSPDMYSVLSTLISAAAALVSNLDKAPIKIPEFYVENLLETTHTLAFYAMQHYVHHGLRSWYNIMGSVDFLGNPIGLVSTLGAGVKDFFYTPAQMLLEDEKGLRIDNLRTGMTKGSKSLLRNTAVGIFHTTGKITETLGKGIAMLAMDEQYNVQRQRQSSKQIKKINDLGDAIAEGGKGLAGGVWDGIKGVVAAPVRGAERDGASGFVFGIGKGFAGLIVKPTAGFLDLLTSLSRGAKTSAEAIDGADHDSDTVTRFRLPRRVCSDGVLVAYSEREATGNAILLLTALDATDEYVYHVYYGNEPLRGLVLLTDKRIVCLSATSGQRLWEVALDSTLQVEARGSAIELQQHASSSHRTLSVECDDAVAATNFRVAVDSARMDLSATRYLLLNLEKQQDEARNGDASGRAIDLARSEAERSDLHLLMENVQDTMVTGLTPQDLRAQPLRSVRVELCHLENKDAHAQIQVYGGPYQWTVFRRFSEFRDLLAALQAAGFATDVLPALPPRTFLPSTRASVAKSRQDALSMLLQAAIMHSSISKSALTLEFLTREAQEVRISLPPLSPTGAAADHDASQRGEDSS